MDFNTIFFDLDSTLYPESCGLWQAIRDRINLYLLDQMGFSCTDIPGIRHNFLVNHGTTLRGLQINYNVDPVDYLNFFHVLPLRDFLSSDNSLRKILLSIPHRRWVFTNSDAAHANRVMDILNITDCFEDIIDIWTMAPLCKPMEAVYSFALDYIGGAAPNTCALIDDSTQNLTPAKKLGFLTVLVGHNGQVKNIDHSITTIHELPEVVPELWLV